MLNGPVKMLLTNSLNVNDNAKYFLSEDSRSIINPSGETVGLLNRADNEGSFLAVVAS